MSNPVSHRLGKRIGTYADRAQRKRKLEVANQLAKETDWRGDLARSFMQVVEETDDAA